MSDLAPTSLRARWPVEPLFSDWLADNYNLRRLSKKLDLKLHCGCRELPTMGGRCDLLCTIPACDETALIENQFGESDSHHLGQLIAYAASRDSGHFIWIAERFHPKHIQAIDQLNRTTSADQNYFAVIAGEEWTLESEWIPSFRVVSSPYGWETRRDRHLHIDRLSEEDEDLYCSYWSNLKTLEGCDLILAQMAFSDGHTTVFNCYSNDFKLGASLHLQRNQASVYFLFDCPTRKASFVELKRHKQRINETLQNGEIDSIVWQAKPFGQHSSLELFKKSVEIRDRNNWPMLYEWMKTHLNSLHRVLTPYLGNLPLADRSITSLVRQHRER